MRTNSTPYITENFPELLNYKKTTSRLYESKDSPTYYDNWWFKIDLNNFDNNDYVILAGALDYTNTEFRIYKVPVSFIKKNLIHFYNKNGHVMLYITMKDSIDIRVKNNISFDEFRIN